MAARDANEHGLPLARGRLAERTREMERGDIAREPALGLNLQEAGEIFLGQIGNVGVGNERPLQWKADNAITLADTSGIEMIADFASYQFGGRGKRIERQHDRE